MSTPASEHYRTPEASIVDALQPSPSDEELAAFAGPSGGYYLDSWRAYRDGRSGTTPNFAALFFMGLWCYYRRMFWMGLAIAVGIRQVQVLTDIALVRLVDPAASDIRRSFVSLVLVLIGALAWSFLANGVYYRRAVRVIDEVHRATPDASARLERIRLAGGTRIWTIFLGIVASFIAIVIATTLIQVLLVKVFGVGLPAPRS